MTVKAMAGGLRLRQLPRGTHDYANACSIIEVAAKQVATELQRQGIGPGERVTLTIEPEPMPGRRESRKPVIAAGLTDDEIDRLIKQAQHEVEPLLPGEGRRRYQHLGQRRAQARRMTQSRTVASLAALRVAEIRGDRGAVFRGRRTFLYRAADRTGNA